MSPYAIRVPRVDLWHKKRLIMPFRSRRVLVFQVKMSPRVRRGKRRQSAFPLHFRSSSPMNHLNRVTEIRSNKVQTLHC